MILDRFKWPAIAEILYIFWSKLGTVKIMLISSEKKREFTKSFVCKIENEQKFMILMEP